MREAQEVVAHADSLREAHLYAQNEYDDSLSLAQAYETLKEIPLPFRGWLGLGSSYAHACYHYGRLLRAKGNYVEAMKVFIDATHSRTRDFHILGRVYSNIAEMCHLAGEYQLSYDMFAKCADCFLQKGDSSNYFYALNSMAFELAEQGKKDETLVLLDSIARNCNDKNVILKTWETKAEMYLNSCQYDGPKYLIIAAHRNMENILSEYVSYKQGQNYNVQVVYLNENSYGNNNIAIRNIIENNATLPNPDFVLLVGSLDDIPPYQGVNHPDDPYTDDEYHPFLGRWIVTGEAGYYPELERIIQKTISSEQEFARAENPSSAVLFSGKDVSDCTASRVFYNRIKRVNNVSFDRMGIPSTLYDGRYSNVTFNSMCQSLGSHPSFFIYSGHGSSISNPNGTFIVGSGIGSPYLLCPSNLMVSINNVYFDHISSLGNDTPFPMGFGFACSLNTYETNNNFAARWISEYHGGSTFYGATTTSYRSSNNYLSKIMFRALRKTKEQCGNFALGTWLRTGEQKYYNALRNGSRWVQIQKYNLMGDPTFHVFGRESDGTIAPFHVSQKRTDVDTDSEIESVEVYNIYGQLVKSCKSLDFTIDKNNSLYIYKVTYTNGLTKTYKVL